jgi:hypothetical protein
VIDQSPSADVRLRQALKTDTSRRAQFINIKSDFEINLSCLVGVAMIIFICANATLLGSGSELPLHVENLQALPGLLFHLLRLG